MQNSLQVFVYEGSNVRTVMLDGELWFVAKDVCDILGLGNVTQAVSALDDDEKMTLSQNEGHSGKRGGAQSLNVVSEPGLYALIFKSQKPEAKAFARWVRHELLPQVMHTGLYNRRIPVDASPEVDTLRKITTEQYSLAERKKYWLTLFEACEPIETILFKTTMHGYYYVPDCAKDDSRDISLLRSILSAAKELIHNKLQVFEQRETALNNLMKSY